MSYGRPTRGAYGPASRMAYGPRPYYRPYVGPGVRTLGPVVGGVGPVQAAELGVLGGTLGALGGTLGCLLCLAAIGALGLFACVIAITAYTKEFLNKYKSANGINNNNFNGAAELSLGVNIMLIASFCYVFASRTMNRN